MGGDWGGALLVGGVLGVGPVWWVVPGGWGLGRDLGCLSTLGGMGT